MNGLRFGITAIIAAATLGMGVSQAQIRIIDRASIDSLMSPATVGSAATVQFATTRLDAGTINEDDGIQAFDFRFRNTGSESLVITRITTTCGCTTAKALPTTVPAGGEGRIAVNYNPKGHVGSFERRIFVYTPLSATQPTAVLTLAVKVEAGRDYASVEYPFAMGSLRLKRNAVSFVRGRSAAESIEVCNTGERPITIGFRRELLPTGITAECEPSRIPEGGRAEITVRYDAGCADQHEGGRTIPLMFTGTGQTPLQSTIKINIEQ